MDERLIALREAPKQIAQGLQAIAEASVYFSIATLLLAVLTALLLQAFYDFWLRRSINKWAIYDWLTERRNTTFASLEKLLGRRLPDKPPADQRPPAAAAHLPGQEQEIISVPPPADKRPPAAPTPIPSTTVGDMRKRSGLEEIGIAEDSSLFDLPYPKLCAQISVALQNAIDLGRAPAVGLVFAGLQDREVEHRRDSEKAPEDDLTWVDSLVDQFAGRTRELAADQRGRERQILTMRVERGVDELQSELARRWVRSVYRWSFGISVLLLGILLAGARGIDASFGSFVIIVFLVLAAALLAPPLQRLIGRAFAAR